MYVVKLQLLHQKLQLQPPPRSIQLPSQPTLPLPNTQLRTRLLQLVLPSTPLLHLLILLPQNIQLLSPPMPLVQTTQLQNHLFQLLLPNIQLMILPQSLLLHPQHLQLLVNTPSTSLTNHQKLLLL